MGSIEITDNSNIGNLPKIYIEYISIRTIEQAIPYAFEQPYYILDLRNYMEFKRQLSKLESMAVWEAYKHTLRFL